MSVSKYQKYFDKCINFNQNNKYHNLTLDKHIECAVNRAKELGYSDTIIEALKWHDFGKLAMIEWMKNKLEEVKKNKN